MFSVLIEPGAFTPPESFAAEIRRRVEWVKASPPAAPGGEILVPGEPEERTRADRAANGLPLDETTWSQLLETAASVGVSRDEVDAAGFPAPGAMRRG
ncbi:MAG: Ldh family oxidoreductase [Candidatus Rokubacteria bacterium]|nr:Ldh family oxidoreductase [Candidatus Rokubacteria bacterium]